MTRNKQIAHAAIDYMQSDAVDAMNMQLAFGDFINGANWADKNPNWIEAEDKMPEPIKGYTVTEFVLVSWKINWEDTVKPRYATVAQYDFNEKKWITRENKIVAGVTHWMPIVLPKED